MPPFGGVYFPLCRFSSLASGVFFLLHISSFSRLLHMCFSTLLHMFLSGHERQSIYLSAAKAFLPCDGCKVGSASLISINLRSWANQCSRLVSIYSVSASASIHMT